MFDKITVKIILYVSICRTILELILEPYEISINQIIWAGNFEIGPNIFWLIFCIFDNIEYYSYEKINISKLEQKKWNDSSNWWDKLKVSFVFKITRAACGSQSLFTTINDCYWKTVLFIFILVLYIFDKYFLVFKKYLIILVRFEYIL